MAVTSCRRGKLPDPGPCPKCVKDMGFFVVPYLTVLTARTSLFQAFRERMRLQQIRSIGWAKFYGVLICNKTGGFLPCLHSQLGMPVGLLSDELIEVPEKGG